MLGIMGKTVVTVVMEAMAATAQMVEREAQRRRPDRRAAMVETVPLAETVTKVDTEEMDFAVPMVDGVAMEAAEKMDRP